MPMQNISFNYLIQLVCIKKYLDLFGTAFNLCALEETEVALTFENSSAVRKILSRYLKVVD